jgi:hypothetical protein
LYWPHVIGADNDAIPDGDATPVGTVVLEEELDEGTVVDDEPRKYPIIIAITGIKIRIQLTNS